MLAVLPAIGLLVGVLCVGMPESPRWLASEEHYEQAFEVLKKIRVSEMEALIELEEMRKTAEEDQQATFRCREGKECFEHRLTTGMCWPNGGFAVVCSSASAWPCAISWPA